MLRFSGEGRKLCLAPDSEKRENATDFPVNHSNARAGYSPNTLAAAIRHLRDSQPVHIQLGRAAIDADQGKLYPEDSVVLAVIQRSLDLIDGFTTLTEKGNATAAIPLLRLQLDNCMRFFACTLANEVSELVRYLLSGKPINTLKSRSGKRLTDRHLLQELDAQYPGFSEIYESASGFIHLSTPGMVSSVVGVRSETEQVVQCQIGFGAGRNWTEEEKKEAVDAFIRATEILYDLLRSWGVTKAKIAAERSKT